MSDEYRSWSKNLFVTSNNRTPHWRIFKNFPNNVKVWYNILSFAILFIKKVSISVFESFKYVERQTTVFYIRWLRQIYPHSPAQDFIRVNDDVDFVFFCNQFVKCLFFFSAQIGTNIEILLGFQ